MIIIKAIINPNPSDPKEVITGSKLSNTPPKKGALGPNRTATRRETATTRASILVISHNQSFSFSIRSIIYPPVSATYKKERGTSTAPLS